MLHQLYLSCLWIVLLFKYSDLLLSLLFARISEWIDRRISLQKNLHKFGSQGRYLYLKMARNNQSTVVVDGICKQQIDP
jgi:hypothetical protein